MKHKVKRWVIFGIYLGLVGAIVLMYSSHNMTVERDCKELRIISQVNGSVKIGLVGIPDVPYLWVNQDETLHYPLTEDITTIWVYFQVTEGIWSEGLRLNAHCEIPQTHHLRLGDSK